MAKWQKRSAWRRFCHTRTAIVIAILLGLWLGHAVWQAFWSSQTLATDRQDLENQLAAVTAKESKLQGELARLQTPAGLEQKIRERFSVVKPGERVIAVVAAEAATSATTSLKSWWQTLWGQ